MRGGRKASQSRASSASLSQGYTLVWSAWQADAAPGDGRLVTTIPIARNVDGSPIRKWITTEILADRATRTAEIDYPAAEGAAPKAMFSGPDSPTLTGRARLTAVTSSSRNTRPAKNEVWFGMLGSSAVPSTWSGPGAGEVQSTSVRQGPSDVLRLCVML